MAKLGADDETYDAKVTVLKELVEHHVKEEEEELFPKCREAVNREVLQEVGVKIEEPLRDALVFKFLALPIVLPIVESLVTNRIKRSMAMHHDSATMKGLREQKKGKHQKSANGYDHTEASCENHGRSNCPYASDFWLWTGVAAAVASLVLFRRGDRRLALLVGQWVPSILTIGTYNKIVKVAGSDQEDNMRTHRREKIVLFRHISTT